MRPALFTKLFGATSIDDVATASAELGFDALDVLVRPGCTVDPTAISDLPRITRALLQSHQMAVPMVTTDITDPATGDTDRIFGACAQSGVRMLRLGYWGYDGSRPYAEIFAGARRNLDDLEKLAHKHGVQLAIQLHGGTIHAGGATTRALLEGHDPQCLGAYPDPGNQAVQDGRDDWRLTFDLLRPWLCCVGVKNGGWFPAGIGDSGQRSWHADWLGLSEGMVPWPDILRQLRQDGFDGILSFHSHYEAPLPQVLDQTRSDLRFVQRTLSAA